MCQKLWKLAESRQSYCNDKRVYFLTHPIYSYSDVTLNLIPPPRQKMVWRPQGHNLQLLRQLIRQFVQLHAGQGVNKVLFVFVIISTKYWTVFKILSLAHSTVNLQHSDEWWLKILPTCTFKCVTTLPYVLWCANVSFWILRRAFKKYVDCRS